MPQTPDGQSTVRHLALVGANQRVRTLSDWGDKFWKLLPHTSENNVPVPLILGGSDAPNRQKQERLALHIRYASEQGVLRRVDRFLRSLPPDGWIYDGASTRSLAERMETHGNDLRHAEAKRESFRLEWEIKERRAAELAAELEARPKQLQLDWNGRDEAARTTTNENRRLSV